LKVPPYKYFLFYILTFLISITNIEIIAGELDQNDVVLVDSVRTNRICFHTNTQTVDSLQPLIIEKIKLAVHEVSKIIELENVEFRVVVFPERTIPSKGMSGVAPDTEFIYILLNPDHPRLLKTITEEMVATIAHEYHHTLRHRTFGYVTTLFDAIVSEGLADHFSTEVTGLDPHGQRLLAK
jgi:uncharacterized protein YjaZ